jgi:hypothetical protein
MALSRFFPQVPARELDEHVLEAGLSRGQMQQLGALPRNRIEQRWNGDVRLANGQADQPIIGAYRFHTRQTAPAFLRKIALATF